VQKNEQAILADWMKTQLDSSASRADLIREAELREQSRNFLAELQKALQAAAGNVKDAGYDDVRRYLKNLSASRAEQGFTPSETAMFIFSLKQPLFELLRKNLANDPNAFDEALWESSALLDQLGLFTTEAYQQTRSEIIARQQVELQELSTPVVQIWKNVLALPLVGTLDSSRTQVVMETLLQRIVDTGAEIAIIDITGVPTVDTLVAQHLMKTIAATRLMGADCIISGIRPQIAQTIVHLGVDLGEVTTKATLADALAVALQRLKGAKGDTTDVR
jgi:rsbT co-antagonist protein RsbR